MSTEPVKEPNPNIHLNGDESRLLMSAMMFSNTNLPVGLSLRTYMRLAALSQVQPAEEPKS